LTALPEAHHSGKAHLNGYILEVNCIFQPMLNSDTLLIAIIFPQKKIKISQNIFVQFVFP